MNAILYLYILCICILFSIIIAPMFKNGKFFVLIFSLVNIPLLTSLLMYGLFSFVPNADLIVYASVMGAILLILSVIAGKNSKSLLKEIYFHLQNYRININGLFAKTLFIFIITILTLVFLRMWLWPINWDDQIYYIEQAYSIGQDRNTARFLNWGYFKNDQLNFQINPSIRPGLPLLFSLSALYSNKLGDTVQFSRIITFHYFICVLILLIYLAKRNKLLTTFFTLSCYLFVNLSVSGFKELIIISQILLLLKIFSETNSLNKPEIFLTGITCGLMAYVNYSGTLISAILLLLYIIFGSGNRLKRVFAVGTITLMMVVFSGFEVLYFAGIALDGGFRRIDVVQQTVSLSNYIKRAIAHTSVPAVTLDNSGISQNNGDKSELASYDIHTTADLYIKGKLQGFFQIQYFGCIFILFLLITVTNFNKILTNKFLKWVVIFVIAFYVFFIDIFNFNHHQFATVLSISHKYSAMLVPLLALVIAYCWGGLTTWFRKIGLIFIVPIFVIIALVGILYFNPLTKILMNTVGLIIPVHDTFAYYDSVIRLALKIATYLGTAMIILITTSAVLLKKKLPIWWLKNDLTAIIFLTMFFYLPFLFFFHTNFGLDRTLMYSFSPRDLQLNQVKGWESIYNVVTYMNAQPKNTKYLFVDRNVTHLAIHFTFPASNIYSLNSSLEYKETRQDILKYISDNKIDYLLIDPKNSGFPNYNLVKQTADFAVYHTVPAN